MFKFTFAGFIMLSLVIGYTVFRFMAHVTRKGNLSNWGLTVSIIMIVLIIFIPGHYTLRSLDQRSGEISSERYQGLDGTAYLTTYQSSYSFDDHSYDDDRDLKSYEGNLMAYKEAIDWFNSNVKGSKNIREAHGLSYSDKCIISSYTGLPTIAGWQTHEQLWHFQGMIDDEGNFVADPERDGWNNIVGPRYGDLQTIYSSADVDEVSRLLHLYDVTYVICGDMELSQMHIVNYSVFDQIGQVVFTSSDGSLKIYKVQ
jgi:uncharacterized membrane protein